jgi:hypothetical protein
LTDSVADIGADPSVTTGLDASPDLMAGLNANFSQHRSKFAPYTKSQRNKRRQEVYRLHFEVGISARKIAGIMRIDKNTVNSDIQLLYKELGKTGNEVLPFSSFFERQMTRLSSLRDDLIEYRNSTTDIDAKRALTAQMADLDLRMLRAAERIENSDVIVWQKVAHHVNAVAEKQKLNYQTTGIFDLLKVTPEGRKAILKIMKKEGLGFIEVSDT